MHKFRIMSCQALIREHLHLPVNYDQSGFSQRRDRSYSFRKCRGQYPVFIHIQRKIILQFGRRFFRNISDDIRVQPAPVKDLFTAGGLSGHFGRIFAAGGHFGRLFAAGGLGRRSGRTCGDSQHSQQK